MTFRLQLIIVILVLLGMIYILNRISKKRLSFKFGLTWILIMIIIMVFAIWPKALQWFSSLIGIYDPVNMLFLFGFVLLVLIIFSLTMEISKISEQNKKLSQEIAILRKDTYDSIKELEKKE